MPLAVEFPVCTGVAGCLYPRSCRVLQITTALVQLVNRDLSSSLAAYPRTFFIIWLITKIATFGRSLLLGFLQFKNERHRRHWSLLVGSLLC